MSPYNANEIQDLTLISQTIRHTGIQVATKPYFLLSLQTKFCVSRNLSSLYTCLQFAPVFFDNSQFKKEMNKVCSQWHKILSVNFRFETPIVNCHHMHVLALLVPTAGPEFKAFQKISVWKIFGLTAQLWLQDLPPGLLPSATELLPWRGSVTSMKWGRSRRLLRAVGRGKWCERNCNIGVVVGIRL